VRPMLAVRRAGTYIGSSPSLGSLTARRGCSVRGCRRQRYQAIARRFVGRFLQARRQEMRIAQQSLQLV